MVDVSAKKIDFLPPPPTSRERIIIVGAGVFGLSTALHLLQEGYRNVFLFDGQDVENSRYQPFNEIDSASADTRKVIRAAYGSAGHHTTLAMEAIEAWKFWNSESSDPLFVNCGWARLNERGETIPVELGTLQTMEELGLRHTQYRLDDPAERQRAISDGWSEAQFDPLRRFEQGSPLGGILDASAGFVKAADACTFVLEKIKSLGGSVLSGQAGQVAQILYEKKESNQEQRKAIGVKTTDGKEHLSDFIVVAAGANTHFLVPGMEDILTASAGSIVHMKVPPNLQERFHPDRFPVVVWNYAGVDETGSISIFPLDEMGTLKFLYNGPQWRNIVQKSTIGDNPTNSVTSNISQPTRWSYANRVNVPNIVLDGIKNFVREYLPELTHAEILVAKLCWDSQTVHGDFIIDWVPNVEGCLVASGGSNHGFKFLPTLGKYVSKVLRGESDEFTEFWKWTTPSTSDMDDFRAANVASFRALDGRDLATSQQDLKW